MKNYVKKHKGHDVPEGATHYSPESGDWFESFFKCRNEKVFGSIAGNHKKWIVLDKPLPESAIELPEQDLPNWDDAPEWADRLMRSPAGYMFFCNVEKYTATEGLDRLSTPIIFGLSRDLYTIGEFELIEMRPIAIEDKEWLPKVGEKIIICFDDADNEALNDNELRIDGSEVSFIGSVVNSVGETIFVFEDDDNFSDCYPSEYFNPLKTAEELERDALLECVYHNVHRALSKYNSISDDAIKAVSERIISKFDIIQKEDG